MKGDGDLTFREVRYFKRGAMAQWFAFLALCCAGAAILVDGARPLLAAAVVLFVPFLLRFETAIGRGQLTMQVRPFWRGSVPIADVEAVEVTIWDGQVGFFGGYTGRTSIPGALVASVEGHRSVGNRAVVLHLRSGVERQVGTFQPRAFIEAIEREAGRALQR